MWHRSADSRVSDVPVAIRAVAGGGIVPFLLFVVAGVSCHGHFYMKVPANQGLKT